MISVPSLWLPILVSAIVVLIVSSIIHMFLKYHRSDFTRVSREDEVMESLRTFDIAPGDYVLPCAGSPDVMKSDDFKEKLEKGPIAFLTVMPTGSFSTNKSLIYWFIYCIVVSIFAAYITGRALGPGADYLEVFRFAGCTAFIGYALALWQNTIWYKRKWSSTIKSTIDGLIYGLLTAGVFGWLWPNMG